MANAREHVRGPELIAMLGHVLQQQNVKALVRGRGCYKNCIYAGLVFYHAQTFNVQRRGFLIGTMCVESGKALLMSASVVIKKRTAELASAFAGPCQQRNFPVINQGRGVMAPSKRPRSGTFDSIIAHPSYSDGIGNAIRTFLSDA